MANHFRWSFNDRPPKRVPRFTICLTDNCNLRCSYCYEKFKSAQPTKMPLDILKTYIDNLFTKHVSTLDSEQFSVRFFGGEPFLYPDLIDYGMSYIKETYDYSNALFFVITNGTLLKQKEVQAVIIKHPELQINVSLDGSKEVHNRFRGMYDEVVAGVKWLKTQRNNLTLHVVASPDSVDKLSDSFRHVVDEIGVNNIWMPVAWDDERWAKDIYANLLYKELCKIAEFMCEPKHRYAVWCNVFNPFLYEPLQCGKQACFFEEISCDHNGDLYSCISFKNVGKNFAVGNVWDWINDSYYRLTNSRSTDIMNVEKCHNCDIASGCNTCYANYALKNGDHLHGDDHYCKAHHACYYAMLHLLDVRAKIVDESEKMGIIHSENRNRDGFFKR